MNAIALTIVIVTVIMAFVIGSQRRINERCKDAPKYSYKRGEIWRQ